LEWTDYDKLFEENKKSKKQTEENIIVLGWIAIILVIMISANSNEVAHNANFTCPEGSTKDEATGMCIFVPDMDTINICGEGEFDASTGMCTWIPETVLFCDENPTDTFLSWIEGCRREDGTIYHPDKKGD